MTAAEAVLALVLTGWLAALVWSADRADKRRKREGR